MGTNQFAETLVETMLVWMRWLVNWVWAIFRDGAPSALTSWFADHWISVVAVLIVAGLVIDWLVWMIRWRPYWLWFRKKQIIYEDETDRKTAAKRPAGGARVHRPEDAPHFEGMRQLQARRQAQAQDDFDDPFAEDAAPKKRAHAPALQSWDSNENPYGQPEAPAQTAAASADWEGGEDPYSAAAETPAPAQLNDWDGGEDPYAAAPAPAPAQSAAPAQLTDWEGGEDPYAQTEETPAAQDNTRFMRPAAQNKA